MKESMRQWNLVSLDTREVVVSSISRAKAKKKLAEADKLGMNVEILHDKELAEWRELGIIDEQD